MTLVRPLATPGTRLALEIQHTWDGIAVGVDEVVAMTMELGHSELTLRIDAPFHGDPPPDGDDLWMFEVVELMLVGADVAYLEVELSPHGQYLVLCLHGERHVVERGAVLEYDATIQGARWQGVAHLPIGWLPVETSRLNAFAMHGRNQERRHLAWKPTGGPRPDFHRLKAFGLLAECLADDTPPIGR